MLARGGYAWLRCRSKRMGTASMSTTTVPVVDFGLSVEEVGIQIHEACTTVGFFYLTHHGVPDFLYDRVVDQARHMFTHLSDDEKDAFSVAHSNSYRGYQRMGVNVTSNRRDGHEALDLVSESKAAIRTAEHSLTNYGQNLWPDPCLVPGFRSTIEDYVAQMIPVGKRLADAASLGLGLGPDYFRPYFTDAYWSMRLIRYPPTTTNQTDKKQQSHHSYDYGVGEHCDYGVFTMILCDDIPHTLQIRPKGSAEWMWVDPIPGAFICNIGDMLARWTNNLYVSTPHRVLRPKHQDRISVPFFFDPNYDSLIAPIDALVEQSGKPPCFDRIMYGDHLLAKTSNNFIV